MSNKVILSTHLAPKAIGAYSQGVLLSGHGNIVYLSGQIAIDPNSNKMELCSDKIEEQVLQVMKNIKAILNEANFSLDNIVKTSIYLASMEDFKLVNEIYAGYFSKKFPSRTMLEVSRLPLNALVEIDCIAVA